MAAAVRSGADAGGPPSCQMLSMFRARLRTSINDMKASCWATGGLLSRNPRLGDHFPPVAQLVGQHLLHVLGGTALGNATEGLESGSYVRHLQRLLQLGVQAIDDRARHALRRDDARPGLHVE